MNAFGTSVAFSPLVPWLALYIFAGAGIALVAASFFLRARGGLVRGLAIAVLWLILANPSLVVENRQPLRDIAVVVVDESPSQSIEERDKKTAEALAHVRESLKRIGNVDLRVVRAGIDRNEDGTLMFGAIERALTDIPRNRLAGVMLITDGQVHDAPLPGRMLRNIGPLHTLLTGKRGEADRRLDVKNAPAFGLLGKPLAMTLRIDDEAASRGERTQITIKRDGVVWKKITVATNRDVKVDLELEHRGTTFFELEVAEGTKELTLENNRKVVTVHGVRDRLRVLLISGEPHPGERAWRNLLKSDPGVDLVHFTILRPPEKRDMTPVNELALISFPVRELFQEKLDQFHLIIFDRYRRRGVIRTRYLQNIADYVRNGGALMVAAGPAYAGALSLQHTPIGPLLPGRPNGQVFDQGFRPKRTELGIRHPVTASLTGKGTGPDPWGRWFRQIEATRQRGTALLGGIANNPLLILDRVGKGRVAQLLSDQGWLWDRGFEGGGPYAEMLRRVSHWLMKEPELEEESLSAQIQGKRLTVLRRSLKPIDRKVDVTLPDGKTVVPLPLKDRGDGTAVGTMTLERPGLYRITDGKLSAMAAIGSLNAREMADVRTTDGPLKPVVGANTGSFTWMGDDGIPEIRMIDSVRVTSGRGGLSGHWIGLKRNGDYVVTGIRDVPLLIGLIALLIALLPLLLAWRREGR